MLWTTPLLAVGLAQAAEPGLAPAALPPALHITGQGGVAVDADGAAWVAGVEGARRPLLGGPLRGRVAVYQRQGAAWTPAALPAPDGLSGGWADAPASRVQVATTDMGKVVVAALLHPAGVDAALVVCADEGDGWACDRLPLPDGRLTSPELGVDDGYWSVVAHIDERGGDDWAGIVRWEEGMTEMERWARVGDGVEPVARVHGAGSPAVVYRSGARLVMLDHTDQERSLGPAGGGPLAAAAVGPTGAVAVGFDPLRRLAMARDGARRDLGGPVAGEAVASTDGLVAWTWRDHPFSGGVTLAAVTAEGLGAPWVASRAPADTLALGRGPSGAVALVSPGPSGALALRQYPSLGAAQAAALPGDDAPRRLGVQVRGGAVAFSRAVRAGAPGALPVADEVVVRGETLAPDLSVGFGVEGDLRFGRARGSAAWAFRGAGGGGLVGEQHVTASVGVARLWSPWGSLDLDVGAYDLAAEPIDSPEADPSSVSSREVVLRAGLPGGLWAGPAAQALRGRQDVYELDDGEAVASADTDGQLLALGLRAGWRVDPDGPWERPRAIAPVASAWVGAAAARARFSPDSATADVDRVIEDDVETSGIGLEAGGELGVQAVLRRPAVRGAGLTGRLVLRGRASYFGQPSGDQDAVFQRLDRNLTPTLQLGGAF